MAWQQFSRHLYGWTDTCNVYALVHEGRALLVDCGAGEVADHLAEIGVEAVDWVLYTHHHREQCQGHLRLTAQGAQAAVPAAEAHLFQDPTSLWDNLEAHTVYGTPFVRPPVEPLAADRLLGNLDTFAWGPYQLQVFATPGNSPGAVTYRVRVDGRWRLFSGDVVLAGGTLHTFYDSEWDYGFGSGLQALLDSLSLLHSLLPGQVCPAHGPVLAAPRREIRTLHRRLSRFLRGPFPRDWNMSSGIQGALGWFSRPTDFPGVREFTPRLLKLGLGGANCYLLLGETGRGLMLDCGGLDREWLGRALEWLRQERGLRTVEVLVPSHVHGDHYTEAEYLQDHWGTEVWCLDEFADLLENPYRYNETCLLPFYRLRRDRLPVARRLRDGERFEWDGLKLTAHHLPGQTLHTLGLELELEGRRYLFTGDNLFYAGRAGHNGHEALIARNGSQVDRQYLAGAEKLAVLRPDHILAGHSNEIEHADRQIGPYLQWARSLPARFAELSYRRPYGLFLDPYWLKLEPYLQRLTPGQSGRCELVLRNPYDDRREFCLRPALPEGWQARPREWRVTLEPGETVRQTVRFWVPPDAWPGTHLISADLTAGEDRWGEFFDARVDVLLPGAEAPAYYDRVKRATDPPR